MTLVLFRNASVLHADRAELTPNCDVLVENGRIREVSEKPIQARSAAIFDVKGNTLMPGLIDCHVHSVVSQVNLAMNEKLPNVLAVLRALPLLKGMLSRGFTTVRDAGGADWSLAEAISNGLIAGPRLFPSGKALSQTGGHGDFRPRSDQIESCSCSFRIGALARIADGVESVRLAAREEIAKGATQIKVMASGGVASPNDPIHYLGYSEDELRAIVEEASNADTYVMAHVYTPRAIRRAVDCGIRTIEHGNLVDKETAKHVAAIGAYAVPTTIASVTMAKYGADIGYPAHALAKIENVRQGGLDALKIWWDAGVTMGYGSDLLGEMQVHQGGEFRLRADVIGNAAAIACATVNAAQILNRTGELGVIAAGAIADILIVDGDPLKDIGVLDCQGKNMAAIMKNGIFFKNELAL